MAIVRSRNIEIARRAECVNQLFDLVRRPAALRLGHEISDRRQHRAQPAHRDPHLVNAFDPAGERHGLAAQEMGQASAADAL
jgi:hypothetical protein